MQFEDPKSRKPHDIGEIRLLVTATFDGARHSDGSEGYIVDGLRECEMVGHVALSPVQIDGREVRLYGPGQSPYGPTDGVRMIEAGLDQIEALEAAGCVAQAILPFLLASGSMPIHRRAFLKLLHIIQSLDLGPMLGKMSLSIIGSIRSPVCLVVQIVTSLT